MITLELARRLRAAGLTWSPQKGDRFVVPDRDMDTDIFVISEMVVEVRDVPAGRILAFNGTTEWALDSVDAATVVWMPREAQLRDLLGDAFVSLERLELGSSDPSQPVAPETAGYAVTALIDGQLVREIDIDSECAYARALLELLAD